MREISLRVSLCLYICHSVLLSSHSLSLSLPLPLSLSSPSLPPLSPCIDLSLSLSLLLCLSVCLSLSVSLFAILHNIRVSVKGERYQTEIPNDGLPHLSNEYRHLCPYTENMTYTIRSPGCRQFFQGGLPPTLLRLKLYSCYL